MVPPSIFATLPPMSESTYEPIRLTTTVQKGGCAAKVAATELRKILGAVHFPVPHPELLVDGRLFDDAAIYRVSDELALVQTVDFFTPILDSPRAFGRVAAANALSDVYAMGGRPKTALAILGFPLASLANSIASEVLQGACDILSVAGANLVGGHSIDDDSLKFGLAVTGYVHPDRVWTNAGARPGDALILTKALGTGVSTAALKRAAVSESEIAEVVDSMATLNNVIDVLSEADAAAIHAATDVTGFGLSGHAMQMARASDTSFEIKAAALPLFTRAREFAELGFLTKAHRTNRDYTKADLATQNLDPWQELLLHDPQTSGGLLLSVASPHAEEIVDRLKTRFPQTCLVGSVHGGRDQAARVTVRG